MNTITTGGMYEANERAEGHGDIGKFTQDQIVSEDADAGIRLSQIGNALMTYTAMNYGRRISVEEAAKVFNTTEAVIITAVEDGPWTYIGGTDKKFIELDGD